MLSRTMKRLSERLETQALLETCRTRSIELLKRNLTDGGILAATAGKRAEKRGYTAIFGRDAAVCAIGMAVSGDKQLEQAAVTGLDTLGRHQAPNGQIAKVVHLHGQGASHGLARKGRPGPTLSGRMQAGATHALHGLTREGNPGPTMSGRMPAQEGATH